MRILVWIIVGFLSLCVAAVVCPCLLVLFFAWVDPWSLRHPNFDRLLAGDEDVRIRRLVIFRPCRREAEFEFEDPDTLHYLSQAIRAAMPASQAPGDAQIGGVPCDAVIELEPAGRVAASLRIPDANNGLTFAYRGPGLGDPDYYWVPFDPPIPARLAGALRHLR